MYPCIIPLYKSQLDRVETQNLAISLQHIDYPLFIAPIGLSLPYLSREHLRNNVKRFSSDYFDSIKDFNRLFLSSNFWREFIAFQYVGICQTDALLISKMDRIYNLDFDYIGAPWLSTKKVRFKFGNLTENSRKYRMFPYHSVQVGNGGLSLRRVRAMLELSARFVKEKRYGKLLCGNFPEDLVYSYFLKRHGFRVPNAEEASNFFVEEKAISITDWQKYLGFHALHRMNPKLQEEIFKSFSV